jgi:hypothetical protein
MLSEKITLAKRFAKAYVSLAAMMAFVLLVSLSTGSGWKIILVGMPLFLTFFAGITYQLVKELRTLKRKNMKQ